MAITLKRKRGAVSYKEPSSDISDEEVSTDSDQQQQLRTKRAAPRRRSARSRQSAHSSPRRPYKEPSRAHRVETEDSIKLRGRGNISYRDLSTDEEESDGDFEVEVVAAAPRAIRTRTSTGPSPRIQREKKSGSRIRKALGAPMKRRATPEVVTKPTTEIVSDGNIPAWDSLPYHVLLQVFVYAAHPLHDENMVPTKSIPWLVQMARMCSAFTKPALTALYRNPPIFAIKQNRKSLVHHLISPPAGAHENYSVMVKRLELDATKMSSLTDATHSATDLAALVSSLTTLKDFDIFDPIDKPPYRSRLKSIRRWHYPDELFEALRQNDAHLRSWRWNSIFCPQGPLWMKEIHAHVAFQSLRDVTLTKFHPDSARKADDVQPTTEELLGSALSVLPNLRSLTFENCLVVNEHLLPLLPGNLVNLNMTNCRDLTSDALHTFLVTHGARLEELILNHDQSLDLQFLVDLKQICPRLEVLRIDMTYYSSLVMSSDNEPLWDELLKEGELPSWPSTLRVIELENIRNWISVEGATSFFNSLIDAAEELPYLRELTLMTMVDIDWRQRAEFRKRWTARFQHVFAQQAAPPNPHLVSLRAFREWKSGLHNDEKAVAEKNDSFLDEDPKDVVLAEVEDSDSDVPLLPLRKQGEKWNTRRLRTRGKASSYDESSGDESSSENDLDVDEPTFIQGKCHTVLFRIGGFRPREHMFEEADFLDAEPSGDEDWNGNDAVEDEYAW